MGDATKHSISKLTSDQIKARTPRVFLFLQGPHGPFFHQLAKLLRRTGASVWRVGFNAGDAAFWPHRASYVPFFGDALEWPYQLRSLLYDKSVTDLVLYGDVRPIHAQAVIIAQSQGLTVHVFEEGYMRPYWITYERNGSNGNSLLMQMSIDQMQADMAHTDKTMRLPPGHWGDMRHHVFYGALYHWFVMVRNRAYRRFRPHRTTPVLDEFLHSLRTLAFMPAHWLSRHLATWRIRKSGLPYHVALLQLEHDSSFQQHSSFQTMTEFTDAVIAGFAKGAPGHHQLVFKAHPLEDGRVNLRRAISRAARFYEVAGRVHYLRGGKLAKLLDTARSAVTVNSTAAHQVLWRGLPLKIFGRAVYDKPELVSSQALPDFFAAPTYPDKHAYHTYRRYLLETSQQPGGYYSARGRAQLLRHVVDRMLSPKTPYEALEHSLGRPDPIVRLVS